MDNLTMFRLVERKFGYTVISAVPGEEIGNIITMEEDNIKLTITGLGNRDMYNMQTDYVISLHTEVIAKAPPYRTFYTALLMENVSTRLVPEGATVIRASGHVICDVCKKSLYAHAEYRYPSKLGAANLGCDGVYYHL